MLHFASSVDIGGVFFFFSFFTPFQGVEGAGPTQEVWRSTVKVERCRYLEASKCKGTCMNLCKLPTEAFFREDLGAELRRRVLCAVVYSASFLPRVCTGASSRRRLYVCVFRGLCLRTPTLKVALL